MHTTHLGVKSYVPSHWGQSLSIWGNFSAWGICLFFPLYLCIQLFLSVWAHEYLIYMFGYNSILLSGSNCSTFGNESSIFQWQVPIVRFILRASLLSGITRHFRLIRRISQPSIGIKYFFRKLWFLLLDNGIRNQDLVARCVHCFCSIVACRLS